MHKPEKLNGILKARLSRFALAGTVALTSLSWGCAARTLTIAQDDRINTAVHLHRPREMQSGDPLEVNVVCVYPDDLEKPENERLKPDSGINAKEWYEFRPTTGVPDGRHFNLPATQIYLLTDEEGVYGKVKGPALRGALEDGFSKKKIEGIAFKKKLHSKKSVIYVFPKFIEKSGAVLPVRPAKFSPPGAYRKNLSVKIGVRPGGPHDGQYVENTAKRRWHGREKDD